ncbi:hypothetical protein BDK51DRAFT_38459 [Blyttiomyces helicus]|uniref:HMG box domain-containing protein n=1 Tax=Blyttiomyces helicus TaxID=388810 RepID=A0A4P9W5F2_9FUNG|nr:hypothetical protein BDK51DRAFT_38459 [Blyttiomyces helicus]|eukprot:RKO87182.1 hypothetical protein BDK51DRAFT_38459 [Blyttiomyces helicus]
MSIVNPAAKKPKLAKDKENFPPKEPRKPNKDQKPKDPAAPKTNATGKLKIKKVDGMPKKPASAFVLFCNEKVGTGRAGYKAENPESTFGEIQKALSVMWKEASPEEKKIHTDRFKSNIATWTLACAAHLATASPLVPTAADEEDLDLDAGDDTDPQCTPPQQQQQTAEQQHLLQQTPLRRAQSYDLVPKIQCLARSPSLIVAHRSDEDRLNEEEEEQVLPDMVA